MADGRRVSLRERISAVFGVASGGAGTFGSLHTVCHYTCEVVVAGLALAGITLTGLPLAFLQDPKLIILFSAIGTFSVGLSLFLHIKTRTFSGASRMRSFLDKQTVLLFLFLLLSMWSLSQGTFQIVQAESSPESPTKLNKEGSAEVELTFLKLKDPTIK